MLRKKNENEVDVRKLNDVIGLSRSILKILFVLLIVVGIYIFLVVIKELELLPFVKTIFVILTPLFIGLLIAWLFEPFVSFLQKKGVKRIFGSAICYLAFIGIMVFMISSIIPLLSEQINDFVTNALPPFFDKAKIWLINIFDKLREIEGLDVTAMQNSVFAKLESFVGGLTDSLPSVLINSVKGFFSGIGTFMIGLIIGFYMLINLDNSKETIFRFVPKRFQKETKALATTINTPLRSFVRGALIDSVVVFIIMLVGFWLFGLKAPLLFALFCAITNLIPYVGPYIGGAPAVLIGFSQSTTLGIVILIFILVFQMVEGNLFQPFIMSKSTKLHPVTIILGLLIFSHFFGIVGMLISTPVIGALKALILYFDEKYDILNFN